MKIYIRITSTYELETDITVQMVNAVETIIDDADTAFDTGPPCSKRLSFDVEEFKQEQWEAICGATSN